MPTSYDFSSTETKSNKPNTFQQDEQTRQEVVINGYDMENNKNLRSHGVRGGNVEPENRKNTESTFNRMERMSTDYRHHSNGKTHRLDKNGDGSCDLDVSLSNRSLTQNGDVDDSDDVGGPCKLGPVQCRCCQKLRRPGWFVLVITLFAFCQGMAINGFVNTVISTLERRFGINSTEGGLIASCYDIMFVILVIPVSYFGGHGNKPRYLAVGSFIMGIGSFVFSLPHFISDDYRISNAFETVCREGNGSAELDYCAANKAPDLSHYKYLFFLGQLLHGAGATALYTLAAVYVDENVSQRSSSVYNAVFYTGAIIGPAVGYVLGGQFLKMHTDLSVDPKSMGLTVNNPRWVGAWWLGFLMSGTFACILAIPLWAFPPSLPGARKYASERGKETHTQTVPDETGTSLSVRDVMLSVKLLLTNVPFMFVNLAAAADAVLVAGFSTFLPKYIEYQFNVPASTAALYVGLVVVPFGGGATFIGGALVTKFDFKVPAILRGCVFASCVLILLVPAFLIDCDTAKFAGVSVLYGQTNRSSSSVSKNLDNVCNVGCGCVEEDYYPMCGRDGALYFSPCYAGCTAVSDDGDVKSYSNCSCVEYKLTAHDVNQGSMYQGEFGKCEMTCQWMPIFLALLSVQIVFMFITSMPSLTVTLRCVPDHQRSFGLGIQWIVARVLGSIPGPILFGKMFDLACTLWQKKCEGSGSCFFYNNTEMRVYLIIIAAAFAILAAVFFFLANWFYVPKANDSTVNLELQITRAESNTTVFTDTVSIPATPVEEKRTVIS